MSLTTINTAIVDKAVAAVKAKAGQFLEVEQKLIELGDRIAAVRRNGSDDAKRTAAIQESDRQVLLSRQKSLETRTFSTLQKAADVKAQAEKYAAQFKGYTSMSQLGARPLELLGQQVANTLTTSRDLLTLGKDIDAHLDDVKSFEKKVVAGEATAVSGSAAHNLFSGTTEILGQLKWLVIGGAALYGLTIVGPLFKRATR